MIERLTYLCGIAVAVISWAIGQLVSDLTSVPVVHTSTVVRTETSTSFELRNLSRAKRIADLTVDVLAPPQCIDKLKPGGTEWTLDSTVDGAVVTVKSLMPGSFFFLNVDHKANCQVTFGLGFPSGTATSTAVRTISGGLESFLLRYWLWLIVILISAATVIFAGSLWKAYQLSGARPN
jgi:hypothetical protein